MCYGQFTYTALLKGEAWLSPASEATEVPAPHWLRPAAPLPAPSSWGCCRSADALLALPPDGLLLLSLRGWVFLAPFLTSAAASLGPGAPLCLPPSRQALCRAGCLVHTPLGCPVGVLNTSLSKSAQSASVHTELSLQVADPIFRCPGSFLGGSSFLCGFLREVLASGFKASPASDLALPLALPPPWCERRPVTAAHPPCPHPRPAREESTEGQPSLTRGLPAAPAPVDALLPLPLPLSSLPAGPLPHGLSRG